MRYNILIGGPAGTGPNVLTHIFGESLVEKGYYVFYSRDYQSLIRGGHNFNLITFGDEPVFSNDSQIDVLVCLDENTEKIHKKNLKRDGVILSGQHENMFFAGRLFKIFCIDFKYLEKSLKKLEKRYEENILEAKEGYEKEKKEVCRVIERKSGNYFINGNIGISEGAIKSGLDIYYAYPMTPATSVLTELAQKQKENNFLVLELENELAVINAAIGSAITGAKSMIGTSGGGFDLMTEALSMTGQAEIPLVIFLSQRPGPGTGVATYTGQGDLQMARYSGHGEFSRMLLAPGDPIECEELTNQAFYFSQKYKIPAIVLSDKHLGESFYTLIEKAKILKVKQNTKLERYNSYEKDEFGSATEDAKIIEKNVIRRLKKKKDIKIESSKFERYKIYGKESKNVVVSWGSTKGAVLDAIKNLDACFLQIKYIEPFPTEIKKIIDGKNLILVENSVTGMLADIIAEKTGIFIDEKNKILRFDGRPFFADELKEEIERRIK